MSRIKQVTIIPNANLANPVDEAIFGSFVSLRINEHLEVDKLEFSRGNLRVRPLGFLFPWARDGGFTDANTLQSIMAVFVPIQHRYVIDLDTIINSNSETYGTIRRQRLFIAVDVRCDAVAVVALNSVATTTSVISQATRKQDVTTIVVMSPSS